MNGWFEDRIDEDNHGDDEHLLFQKSELPMPSKKENVVIHITKDWRQHWGLFFLLVSLIVLSVIIVITILHIWKIFEEENPPPTNMPIPTSTERPIATTPTTTMLPILLTVLSMIPTVLPMLDVLTNKNCKSNPHEGIFIEEGISIAHTKKLPADTFSCEHGTIWFYNFTNGKSKLDNELFFISALPKHCEDFCMCDSGMECYKPKNNSNYTVLFLQDCRNGCRILSLIDDKKHEPFLYDNGTETNTSRNFYHKVDSIGCNGCESLNKCRTCNKQSTLDNLQITSYATTAEITWSVTSDFSRVDLQVSKISAPKKPVWEKDVAKSPIVVKDVLDPEENYTLTVYFYQDTRINNLKEQEWSIAFNRDFRTLKIV
uniref:Fibronectin type-III domain-containing protein n=2 Tax=Acrobeloides nanus TaxID=290746 RepID=A0A914C6T1_9BILA